MIGAKKDNLGQAATWPPTLNFARVIHNSAAHGKITIKDPAAPLVTWRGITITYADSGRDLIGEGFGLGEVIALMFDVDDTLTRINAPVL